MAQQTVSSVEMKHKDGKKRRKLVRHRLYQNGEAIDLKKLAARKTLVRRR